VRDGGKSYDYEGRDILVVVLDCKDAFQMVLEKDDNARQDILNRSLVYWAARNTICHFWTGTRWSWIRRAAPNPGRSMRPQPRALPLPQVD